MLRRSLRPGWVVGHVVVLAAVLVCLRLGWWQWDRSHESTGTAQNLGYALLWPAFGAAFIYMWLRFLQLELNRDREDDDPDAAVAIGVANGEATGDPTAERTGAAVEAGVQAPRTGLDGSPSDGADRADRADGADRARRGLEDLSDDGSDADGAPAAQAERPERAQRVDPRQRPSQGVVISVATVPDEFDDDPEMTAYNRALAALAEEDRRRAR